MNFGLLIGIVLLAISMVYLVWVSFFQKSKDETDEPFFQKGKPLLDQGTIQFRKDLDLVLEKSNSFAFPFLPQNGLPRFAVAVGDGAIPVCTIVVGPSKQPDQKPAKRGKKKDDDSNNSVDTIFLESNASPGLIKERVSPYVDFSSSIPFKPPVKKEQQKGVPKCPKCGSETKLTRAKLDGQVTRVWMCTKRTETGCRGFARVKIATT